MKKIISLILVLALTVLCFAACSGKSGSEDETKAPGSADNSGSEDETKAPGSADNSGSVADDADDSVEDIKITDENNPIVTMTIDGFAQPVVMELYYNKAPNTVKNFVYLINKGFYDGLIFHRVISNFMIQGGCPDGNGFGDPGYSIKGEFTSNGFDNDLPNQPGYLAMARANNPDSAGSQFYISVTDANWLNGDYCVFGKVVSGYDNVFAISKVETNPANDKPLKDIVITSMTVDTHGIDLGEPEMIK